MLPAEERYNLTFEPPRPPGPSKGRLAFASDAPAPRPAAALEPGPRTFALAYDFDGLIAFRHAGQLQQILEFAQKSKATRIEITAYRAASLLSNDTLFTEREDIGAPAGRAGGVGAEGRGARRHDVRRPLARRGPARRRQRRGATPGRRHRAIAFSRAA